MVDAEFTFWKVSKKCRYALRAMFELAWRRDNRPVSVQQIASAQKIPTRFLEIILNELKQGGFLESRRGSEGGYLLRKSPESLTVGEIVRFIEGSVPTSETTPVVAASIYTRGDYSFESLGREIDQAVADIYDSKTLATLVKQERKASGTYVSDYVI